VRPRWNTCGFSKSDPHGFTGATFSVGIGHNFGLHLRDCRFPVEAIDSNSSAVRVRGSLLATGSAPLVGFAMNAGYRQTFETTNEFARIKF